MTEQQVIAAAAQSGAQRDGFARFLRVLALGVGPLVAALVLGGLVLLLMGFHPLS